jgi:hypothetical protein
MKNGIKILFLLQLTTYFIGFNFKLIKKKFEFSSVPDLVILNATIENVNGSLLVNLSIDVKVSLTYLWVNRISKILL